MRPQEIDEIKNPSHKCKRCGSPVFVSFCSDETCPFRNHNQQCLAGWNGHPEMDPNPDSDDSPIACTCKN